MTFPTLKNRLLLDVLEQKPTSRIPVWMMRQAGRYLPEYMVLRKKYSFFERVQTPELVAEITIQPIDIVGTDAAIIFSDILVLYDCLGINVEMRPGFGPYIPTPIRSAKQIDALNLVPPEDTLRYVFNALTLTRNELNGRVPLIGFAGAPWTLFCYLVEGKGSKTFSTAKSFLFSEPKASEKLLAILTRQTIDYLHAQVQAGAQALQVFESWAAALSPDDFKRFALPYLKQIASEDYEVPLIMFAKGAEWAYPLFEDTNVNAFGIGWGCTPEDARAYAGSRTVQGNLDPSKLLASPKTIESETKEMLSRFGSNRLIANLGHGMLPNVPVEHAQTFIDTVKNYSIR